MNIFWISDWWIDNDTNIKFQIILIDETLMWLEKLQNITHKQLRGIYEY